MSTNFDTIIQTFETKITNLLNSVISHCKQKFDETFATKICKEILELVEKAQESYNNLFLTENDSQNEKCPSEIVSKCLHHLLKTVDTHFNRLIVFHVIDVFISHLKISKFGDGKLFEAIVQKLPWYAVRLRSESRIRSLKF